MLDSSTWNLKTYVDPRYFSVKDFEGGFSGVLYLATTPEGKKYLVKHHEMTDASNEFVASRLANKMGFLVAKAYLLAPNEKLSSKYAVAMEYLEGLEDIKSYKDLTGQEKIEIIEHYAFSQMIGNIDIAQLRRYNGHIAQVDLAEAFSMSSMLLKMAYSLEETDMAKMLLKSSREGFAESVSRLSFDFSILAIDLEMDPSEINEIALRAVKRIQDVTDEDIVEIADELSGLYPPEYVENYVAEIRMLQNRIKEM